MVRMFAEVGPCSRITSFVGLRLALPFLLVLSQTVFSSRISSPGPDRVKPEAAQLDGPGLPFSPNMMQENRDRLEETERTGWDLIAISAHSRNVVTRAVLGRTSDKVVQGPHHPVLVYRRK